MSSEWKIIQLSELLSIKPRNGLYKSSEFQGRGSRWVKMKDIYGNDFIKNQPMERILVSEKELDSFGCIEGDLLFGRTSLTLAGVGDCCLIGNVNDIPIFESNLIRIRFNRNIVNPKFYYYYFKSRIGKSAIQKIAKQTAAASITGTDLVNISVNYPSLKEQNLICNLLAPLEHRIELLRETNTTLETIAQALFKSWFVDFDPVHAKQQGRAPEGMDAQTAALFPDSFEESELGMVPKGWSYKTMSDVSTVGIGKTPPRKEPQWFSEKSQDIRWVSIRDMGDYGTYAFKTSEFLTNDAVEKFNVRRIPENTVLMSFKLTVGRLAISHGKLTSNEAIAHFKLDKNPVLSTEYIYMALKNFNFSSLSSTSSIADAVNSKTVRELPILVPEKEILDSFQNIISSIFEKIKLCEQQAIELGDLRDTLLPRLISGQLRLPEAQALLADAVEA